MIKQQRKLKGSSDRFLLTVSEEVGKEIRKNAERSNLSLSAFIGLIVEDYLEQQGWLEEVKLEAKERNTEA